jgi:hypothetical protein
MPDPFTDIAGSLTSGLNTIATLLDRSKENKTSSITLEQYDNYFKRIDDLIKEVEKVNERVEDINLNLASMVSGISNTNTVLRQIYDFVSKRTQPLAAPQLPANTNNTLVEGNTRQQQPLELTPVVARKEIAPPTNTFTSLVPGQSELTQETEQLQEHYSVKKLLALATTQAEGITSIDKNVSKILKKLGNEPDSIAIKQKDSDSHSGGGLLETLESLALYELARRTLANKFKRSQKPSSTLPPATSAKIPTEYIPPERGEIIQPKLSASTRPALPYRGSMVENPTVPKLANATQVPASSEIGPTEFEVLPPEVEGVPETPVGETAKGAGRFGKFTNVLKNAEYAKFGKYAGRLGAAGTAVYLGYEGLQGYNEYQDIEEREKAGKLSQHEALEEKGEKLGERGGRVGTDILAGVLAGMAGGAAGGALFGGVGAIPGTIIGGVLGGLAAHYTGTSEKAGKITGSIGKVITPWAYDTFASDEDKDKAKNRFYVNPYGEGRPQGDGFYNPGVQREIYKDYRPKGFESNGGEFKPTSPGTFKPAPTEQLQKLIIEQPKEASLSLKEIADQASTSNKKFDGVINAIELLTTALLSNNDNNNQTLADIQSQLDAARDARSQSEGGPNNSSDQVDTFENASPMFGISEQRQKFANFA